MIVLYNTFLFEIVRYFDNKAVISITPTKSCGDVEYRTELLDNLTPSFEEWVKDEY